MQIQTSSFVKENIGKGTKDLKYHRFTRKKNIFFKKLKVLDRCGLRIMLMSSIYIRKRASDKVTHVAESSDMVIYPGVLALFWTAENKEINIKLCSKSSICIVCIHACNKFMLVSNVRLYSFYSEISNTKVKATHICRLLLSQSTCAAIVSKLFLLLYRYINLNTHRCIVRL